MTALPTRLEAATGPDRGLDASPKSPRDWAVRYEQTMRCNCDLDNWEPERSTGHSHVCRIHKAASLRAREASNG